jgi:hypothetical protein
MLFLAIVTDVKFHKDLLGYRCLGVKADHLENTKFDSSNKVGTVNSTSDCTLRILYRSYFKGISSNIVLQVYSVT